MSKLKRLTPWCDFAGNKIYEGDTLQYHNGETGIVEYIADLDAVYAYTWGVNHGEDKPYSRLALDCNKVIVIGRVQTARIHPDGVYWVIRTGDETPHYVSNKTVVKFVKGIEEAYKFTLEELTYTLPHLAKMQKNSSWSKPDEYTIVCVKE